MALVAEPVVAGCRRAAARGSRRTPECRARPASSSRRRAIRARSATRGPTQVTATSSSSGEASASARHSASSTSEPMSVSRTSGRVIHPRRGRAQDDVEHARADVHVEAAVGARLDPRLDWRPPIEHRVAGARAARGVEPHGARRRRRARSKAAAELRRPRARELTPASVAWRAPAPARDRREHQRQRAPSGVRAGCGARISVSMKLVSKWPERNFAFSSTRRWNGIEVFTPFTTYSASARRVRAIASPRSRPQQISFAISGS